MDKLHKNVLIIDDEPDTISALEEKFKLSGFSVIKAENGQEGLKLALSDHPSLIILDLIMPEMDGITTLKKLRGNSWGQNVPVIVLTNANSNEKLAQALEIGVDEYLIKSDVKLSDIVEKAKRVTGLI